MPTALSALNNLQIQVPVNRRRRCSNKTSITVSLEKVTTSILSEYISKNISIKIYS